MRQQKRNVPTCSLIGGNNEAPLGWRRLNGFTLKRFHRPLHDSTLTEMMSATNACNGDHWTRNKSVTSGHVVQLQGNAELSGLEQQKLDPRVPRTDSSSHGPRFLSSDVKLSILLPPRIANTAQSRSISMCASGFLNLSPCPRLMSPITKACCPGLKTQCL